MSSSSSLTPAFAALLATAMLPKAAALDRDLSTQFQAREGDPSKAAL